MSKEWEDEEISSDDKKPVTCPEPTPVEVKVKREEKKFYPYPKSESDLAYKLRDKAHSLGPFNARAYDYFIGAMTTLKIEIPEDVFRDVLWLNRNAEKPEEIRQAEKESVDEVLNRYQGILKQRNIEFKYVNDSVALEEKIDTEFIKLYYTITTLIDEKVGKGMSEEEFEKVAGLGG